MIALLGHIAYFFGIRLYVGAVYVASLFHKKAALMVSGRKGGVGKILAAVESDARPKIWFHCASLGEFEQMRPLMEMLKKEKPGKAFILTFFSPSGYEIRKHYQGADYIFYLPFDLKSNADRFVNTLQPEKAFFAKYDIWYHYLKALYRKKIPTYLVSANFRDDQVYFKWYGSFFRKILDYFTAIFSQFESSTRLLKSAGYEQAFTSGDTRFDRVAEIAEGWKKVDLAEKIKENRLILVFGSSYSYEEKLALDVLQVNRGRICAVVVTHEVSEQRIDEIAQLFNQFTCLKFSEKEHFGDQIPDVLIIDSVGQLANFYHYADIAVVGGGFHDKGIHNILEPIAHGVPVLFGPQNNEKFPETKQSIEAGVGFHVRNSRDLIQFVEVYLADTEVRRSLKEKALNFIKPKRGASRYILHAVFSE